MDKLILDSFAKLNLYLKVLKKRKDNFHEIRTVFERIDLSDKIVLTARRDREIRIICSNPQVPKDASNLCWRSAKLLQDIFCIGKGLDIKIIKKIPVGAGLGGGSSNAAGILLGLNKFWGLNLSVGQLAKLAEKLGSDVPFFVYDTAFAQGVSRGEKIKPLSALRRVRFWHILIVPRIKVSTPLIYEKYDRMSKGKENVWLTGADYNVKILNLALRKKDISLIAKSMFNGLETVTCRLYPLVMEIKEKLADLGLKAILMSGSGPAVFGICSSRKEAVSLRRQVKARDKEWRIFVCRTI